MKKIALIIILSSLTTACGTSFKESVFDPYYTTSQHSDKTPLIQTADMTRTWGNNATWQTTPDGYPVW